MLALGMNVIPAQATYRDLQSPVAISATGELTGQTATFNVGVVAQPGDPNGNTGNVVFTDPSGISDSGEAIKIDGGTNIIEARILIYTDNDNNTFVPPGLVNPVANPPDIETNTGVDGAGMVGQISAGYVTALTWGVNSVAGPAPANKVGPNRNVNYAFDANLNDGIGEVYIVDKRHTHSFVPKNVADYPIVIGEVTYQTPQELDEKAMYDADGNTVDNLPNEGVGGEKLYPQRWEEDLYDSTNTATRKIASEALYKSIATVAFGLAVGSGVDEGYYICQVPDLTTQTGADNIITRLRKDDNTVGESLYIYVGSDFTNKPAQIYSTNKLYIAMVAED